MGLAYGIVTMRPLEAAAPGVYLRSIAVAPRVRP